MSITRFKTVAAMAAAALLGGVGATAANATFTDVPDEGAYSEHIENLQEAGIATGFADGTFRPGATINRRQTAAWLDRSAVRVGVSELLASDEAVTLDGAHPTATINTIELTSPAAGDGQGWVSLQAGAGGFATSGAENCPCTIMLFIRDGADRVIGRGVMTVLDGGGQAVFASGGSFAITPLAAGVTETYRLDLELLDPEVSVILSGALFGTYSPLASGDTTGTIFESADTDPVESLVPAIPVPDAP